MPNAPDHPPPAPTWPPGTGMLGFRLLSNLYATLRCRPQNARRTVRNPADGKPVQEELDMSLKVPAERLEEFARVLAAQIRRDSALWAGFDSMAITADGYMFFWPGWMTLRLGAQL